jgi:N-carbamoyl-L-amino-acid hydrolase
MVKINPDRLLSDLRTLRTFGTYKTGVHRPTYSDIDMQSRRWLVERMTDAGLTATIDGIGNVIGRSPAPGPKLLLGSHVETQPHGGWLDGAMGVIFAIEMARAVAEDPALQDCGVDAAAWADEEGHYMSFIGSRSFIGDVTEAEIDGVESKHDGTPLRDALASAGLAGLPRAVLEADRYLGFLEAHIEQGPTLESMAQKIGVVTSIVGTWQYEIIAEGIQNHAGTTAMSLRRDAGRALIKLAHAIDQHFPEIAAERSVWTVGGLRLEPGAPAIVPGLARMLFQFRDADPRQLARFAAAFDDLVAAVAADDPCSITAKQLSASTPSLMHPGFQDALSAAAEQHVPGLHQRMPSGAGHDAQILANVMPTGMMFIPSIGGISHHWSEDSDEADIVIGGQVLATAVGDILAKGRA